MATSISRMRHVSLLVLMLCSVVGILAVELPVITTNRTIRVGCQMGQPPFNDAHNLNETTCKGLFADVFYIVASRMNISFNMTMLDTDHIDPLLNETSIGYSALDIVISFHTITPERMKIIDYPVVLYQTGWRVVLRESFHQSSMTLTDAVIRRSVMYLFTVLMSIAAFFAVIIYIFENLTEMKPNQQPFHGATSQWKRLLFSLEMGVEVVLTGNTSEDTFSQPARFMKAFCGLAGQLFVVNVFAAVLTSQLTVSALQAGAPTLADLRGFRIASASPSITPYMEGVGIGINIVDVHNVEEFAVQFFAGKMLHVSGFIAPTEIAEFIHVNFGSPSFPMTEVFFPTGAFDLKAIPMSPALSSDISVGFSYYAQRLREDGELKLLVDKWIIPAELPVADDFPIPSGAETAFQTVSIVLGAITICVTVLLYLKEKMKAPKIDPGNSTILMLDGRQYCLTLDDAELMDHVVSKCDKTTSDSVSSNFDGVRPT